ncbi:MAG: hypothetical protein WC756_07040 [Taibaiella sp.]|jgi:hypothetical protein
MTQEQNTTQVYFVDQTSERDHHMVFNASMIKVLMLLYPNAQMNVCSILTNQESVKQLLSKDALDKINFASIHNPKVKNGNKVLKALNYFRKEIIRFQVFRKMLRTTSRQDLIFLSITTFTSFTLFKFLKQFYRTRVIAVLHGDIDFIYFPTNCIERINAKAHKWIFRKKLPEFKYLLLNKIAKKNLINDRYLKEDEVYEIDHPFTFLKNDFRLREQETWQPVKIGHIGSMEVERKNSHYIYTLAEKFQEEIKNGLLQFRIAGLITPSVIKYKNEWVHEVVGNNEPDKPQYLTRSQYESELKLLDYCIFFYPEHQYIYRASGAVVDFINGLIPIITLKHPFFDYLFEIGGNIGFVCNDLNEMEILLKRMAHADPEILDQYKQQQKNIQLLQGRFSVETIAKDLKHQMALHF